MSKIMWWGYLHSSGTIQVKRWFGDVKDYTDDCKDNPFVLEIVEPFEADNQEAARAYIENRLKDLLKSRNLNKGV